MAAVNEAADLALQVVDRAGQLADPGDELAGDPADRPGRRGEPILEAGQDDRSIEAAARRLAARVELVEVPAQAVLGPGPLGDEVLAVIDEEADLVIGSVEGRDRQVLAEGGPGDGEGVDRVALAGLAARAAGAGHELGRDPDDGLVGDEQVGRETPTEVPAVLEGEGPFLEPGGPADELEMARARRPDGPLGEPAAGPVDATAVWLRLCESIPMTIISGVAS
ncbi:MAG TPA: hypothetical protein VFO78_07980 [Candidatus Limnocylindrales bacterium]|nr:hypothetical protein [Candidatus Limnocylindrales bacterium]